MANETDSIKIKNQAEEYVNELELRIKNHKTRLDIGKGEVRGDSGIPITVRDPGSDPESGWRPEWEREPELEESTTWAPRTSKTPWWSIKP